MSAEQDTMMSLLVYVDDGEKVGRNEGRKEGEGETQRKIGNS